MCPADHEEQGLRYKFRSWIVNPGKDNSHFDQNNSHPSACQGFAALPQMPPLWKGLWGFLPSSKSNSLQAYIGIPQYQWENKSHKRSKFHLFPIKVGKIWLLEGDVHSGKSSMTEVFYFYQCWCLNLFHIFNRLSYCFPCTPTNSSFSIH